MLVSTDPYKRGSKVFTWHANRRKSGKDILITAGYNHYEHNFEVFYDGLFILYSESAFLGSAFMPCPISFNCMLNWCEFQGMQIILLFFQFPCRRIYLWNTILNHSHGKRKLPLKSCITIQNLLQKTFRCITAHT